MSTEPLDEIQWKSPEWIQQFGLFTGNVLDYFSESPFYDRTSNNQVLRMQFQFQPPQIKINPQVYFETQLKEMTGIEFVLAYVREPDFWIIRKQKRLNSEAALPLQDYYIIGANIYQAPKIYDILSSRLLSTVLSMKKSINALDSMSEFSIQDGGQIYPSSTPSTDNYKSAYKNNINNNTDNLNTVTPVMQTPQINTGTVGSSSAINQNLNSYSSEISSVTFDNLLNNIVQSSNDANNISTESIYLDNIPLYGKDSTVEALGLKINLDSDD